MEGQQFSVQRSFTESNFAIRGGRKAEAVVLGFFTLR
jgi:hypothetical protein